jgi:hypothetical protein
MKITICGSIAFYDEMQKIKEELEKKGHVVDLPPIKVGEKYGKPMSVKDYYEIRKKSGEEVKWVWDLKKDAMLEHFGKVAWSEAILVANYDKNGVEGYIGANTLIEMGVALYLNKPIYLLNKIPEISYEEEILGMQPIILDGDLNKIS